MNDIKIGSKLLELRKKAGFSQGELADQLGVSRQAVSKWECDESLPDTENLIVLSRLYGISIDELVGNAPSRQDGTATDDASGASHKANSDRTTNALHADIDSDDDDDDDDDDEAEAYYSYDNTPADKKRRVLRALHALPFPILAVAAFFLWGFLWDGWDVSWTVFILIPVYYSVLECFRKKRLSPFAYPVFITFVYCLIGMKWGLWHPGWLIYLTVPVYYAIAGVIDRSHGTKEEQDLHVINIYKGEHDKISINVPFVDIEKKKNGDVHVDTMGVNIKINKNKSEE